MSTRKHLPDVLDDSAPVVPEAASGNSRRGGFMGHFLKEESNGLLSEANAAREEAAELRKRIEDLKDSTPVQEIDPNKIRPSTFANRHELAFHDVDFASLAQSIKAAGHNTVPILVRPLGDEYEIAYGHRRVAACKSVGLPVRAIVADLTDQELLAEMVNENEARTSPSAFETGMQLRAILDSEPPIYSTQRDLAIAFKISTGGLSNLLKFAELPEIMVAAFPDPRAIRVYWVPNLLSAYGTDPDGVARLCHTLVESKRELSASTIYNRIIKSHHAKDSVVMSGTLRFAVSKTDASGTTVIRIHKQAPRAAVDRVMKVLAEEAQTLDAASSPEEPSS